MLPVFVFFFFFFFLLFITLTLVFLRRFLFSIEEIKSTSSSFPPQLDWHLTFHLISRLRSSFLRPMTNHQDLNMCS